MYLLTLQCVDKATADFDSSNNLIERLYKVMMFRNSSNCLTVKALKLVHFDCIVL